VLSWLGPLTADDPLGDDPLAQQIVNRQIGPRLVAERAGLVDREADEVEHP
jgi:hypothetical protein